VTEAINSLCKSVLSEVILENYEGYCAHLNKLVAQAVLCYTEQFLQTEEGLRD
jgi:hypothetical protein